MARLRRAARYDRRVTDADYYEDDRLWRPERYESADEQRRFAACAKTLPESVGSVLDVGCGNGAFLLALERAGRVKVLRGLERSGSAIAARVCAAPVDLGDSSALPYDANAFDAVAVLEVLEHLPVQAFERTIAELRRVARVSILVTVPYRERLTKAECPACGCRFHPHRHVRRFEADDLRRMIPGWRVAELAVLDQEDYLFGNVLRSAYVRIRGRDDLTPTSVCPQCGFTPPPAGRSGAGLPAIRGGLRGLLRARLPRRRRPAWWLASYVPASADGSSR